MRTLSTTCLAAGLLGLVAAHASAAVSSTDRNFADKAASGGMAEIQAAQLAQQKTNSPQVKQFANRMVTDHTKANDELQQIAEQDNIQLPSQPGAQDLAATQRLRGMNGTSFDHNYAQEELRDHQQTVALFRQEANSGQDPALKAFAQKTLPTLQQHLRMAQSLTNDRQ